MRSWTAIVTLALSAAISVGASGIAPPSGAGPRVQLWPVPDAGLQPQAVVDASGAVHVLFFRGSPAGGDLYYAVRGASAGSFSTPLRVNSVPRLPITSEPPSLFAGFTP